MGALAVSAGPDAGALFVSPPSITDPERKPSLELAIDIPAGGTVDVPGPAPGFVRLFDQLFLFTQGGASMAAIVINLIDAFATSWQMQGGTPSTQSVLYQCSTPIGAGEVIRLGPNGGADARVVATYQDKPAAGVTLIRTALGVVATPPASVIVIPAPAAGRFRRLYKRTPINNTFLAVGAQVINRDTVSASVRWSLGATLFARAAVANGTQGVPTGPVSQLSVTAASGDLSAVLGAAPTTTAPIFLSAYEDLPL
jgi:hypothetical protein